MSNYLTTDGLKIFSLLPEAPLRPEARGICHMVNPALIERGFVVVVCFIAVCSGSCSVQREEAVAWIVALAVSRRVCMW